jgi:DNA invertase Pin-like site-specific DNA recombinase
MRQPVFYPYIRVSSKMQVLKGKSLEEQADQLQKFYAWFAASWDPEKGPAPLSGVSAHKTPFSEREAGGVLFERLQPGDHIAMISLDRGFRNFGDAVATLEGWIKKGVLIHLLDFKVSTDSAMGELMLRILAVFGQFMRDMSRERILAVKKMLRAQGGLMHELVCFGWKYHKSGNGNGGMGRFTPAYEERETIRLIARLRDECGMSSEKITTYLLENRIFTCARRRQKHATTQPGEWTYASISRAYRAFKANPTFELRKRELQTDSATAAFADSSRALPTCDTTVAG